MTQSLDTDRHTRGGMPTYPGTYTGFRACSQSKLKNVLLRRPVGTPARHQVAELPSTAVILSEHRLQRLRCPDCGATTRAELPPEVPAGALGPRLQAAVVTLAVRNRVSRRDAVELIAELFGTHLSAGSVEAILQRAALALDEPYEDLLGHVRAAAALNID
jgi:transposase